MKFIEISHVVEPGMETYPGLPPPEAEVLLDYETSRAKYQGLAEFYIASLHICGNTGTYVDAPIHRHRGGADLAALSLESLAFLDHVLVDATDNGGRGIGPERFKGLDVADRAVLVRTDFSKHWRTPEYFGPNPFLTKAACELLVDGGARFVGIDSLNIDDTEDLARPAHTALLGAGIVVCEHLTGLSALTSRVGRLHAVPIAWRGGATFPVRAYVVVE